LLEQLYEFGIDISAGALNELLIKKGKPPALLVDS
jgi:hypothetical protein